MPRRCEMSGTGAGAHILIVDDDRLVLATLAQGLRGAGYRVTEASDGASALELVARNAPDLALLDVRMPGMSGVELAERLAAEHQLPFLFLSAYNDADIIERAKELGALGYLVKPLDVPQIIPSLEAALARAAEIRALKDTGEQLSHALESGRETSMAIGILMERQGLDRDEAFEALRSCARSNRRRVHDMAAEILDAVETLNKASRKR
jgi:AmiR/NasT family two-component response regulator